MSTQTQLHRSVEEILGPTPGLVMSQALLKNFILRALRSAARTTKAKEFPLPGYEELFLTHSETFFDDSSAWFQEIKQLSKNDLLLRLRFVSPIICKLRLCYKSRGQAFAADLTEFIIKLDALELQLSVSLPILNIKINDFSVGSSSLELPDRNIMLQTNRLLEEDLKGIETAIRLFLAKQLVSTIFSSVPQVNLESLVPGIRIRGSSEIHFLEHHQACIVGILDKSLPMKDVCSSSVIPKVLGVELTPLAPGQDPNGLHGSFQVGLGDSLDKPGRRGSVLGDGYMGLYLPENILTLNFGKIKPAFTWRDYVGGLFGADLLVSVAVTKVEVKLDAQRMCIMVTVGFEADGAAYVTAELPCIGKVDLAYVRFTNRGSSLRVCIGFEAFEDSLYIVPWLDDVSMASFSVVVSLFSRYLAAAGGKSAVVGFIADAILGRWIASQLPAFLRTFFQENLPYGRLRLLDFSFLLVDAGEPHIYKYGFRNAVSSFSNQSALVGLASLG